MQDLGYLIRDVYKRQQAWERGLGCRREAASLWVGQVGSSEVQNCYKGSADSPGKPLPWRKAVIRYAKVLNSELQIPNAPTL